MSSEWAWLFEATKAIAARISTISFEELLEYLERREGVLALLQENVAANKEAMPGDFNFLEFTKWDRIILNKMNEFKNGANDKLVELSSRKNVRTSYETYSTDTSYFFDSRK